MGEAEILEIILIQQQGITADSMNVTTVFMSFLAVVYLIGNKLTKLSAIGLSILYSVWIYGPIAQMLYRLKHQNLFMADYIDLYPEGVMATEFLSAVALSSTTSLLGTAPLVAGWFLSLLYLFFRVRGSI